MDACLENVKTVRRNKEEKKRLRKQIKASHTLLKHEGINTVSQPTKCLVVVNGGLGNGVSREQLQDALREGGSVKSLLMPPNKPYAFVTYGSTGDSQRAHAILNGHQLQCQGRGVTLYLSFVERVGCEPQVCSDLPPGLVVLEDFVSPEEEAQLLEAIDWTSHSDDVTAQKALKHRRVKHYGYEFRYDNNNVDKDKPLPGGEERGTTLRSAVELREDRVTELRIEFCAIQLLLELGVFYSTIGLPMVCNAMLERCLGDCHIDVTPDQLTVNQYESGQGIPPHVDTHSAFEDTILSLSLGAKTVMDFRHPDGRSVAVVLPERSLLVMKGESRYLWTHGITPRKFDVVPVCDTEGPRPVTSDPGNLTLSKRGTRTSFTFRKVRRTPCDCGYPSACDSRHPPDPTSTPCLPHSEEDASRLETRFVHRVYEEIASHFSSTRHSPWPSVRDFLLALPPGALVADVGCGNGKYLGINPEVISVGCDRSGSLVQICADRGFQAFVSDALDVPLRSGTCDACISIAVIHHFSTQERRQAAINEIVRLLKPGGKALIYVWAMEQEYNKQKSKYLKDTKDEENTKLRAEERSIMDYKQEHAGSKSPCPNYMEHAGKVSPCTNGSKEHSGNESPLKLSVHTNRTAFNSQDLLVPWHLKGADSKGADSRGGDAPTDAKTAKPSPSPVFHRYYHVFQQGELEDLCSTVEDVTVQTSYHDQGNWCVILEKVHNKTRK